MKCEDIKELLATYLDEEVTYDERRHIEAHLLTCEKCREELRILTSTQEKLRHALNAKSAEVSPSAQEWERVKQRITSKSSFWKEFSTKKRIALAAIPFAAALAGFVMFYFFGSAPGSNDLLNKAYAAALGVQSYHVSAISHSLDTSSGKISTMISEGAINLPDSWDIRQTREATVGNNWTSIESIAINGVLYIKQNDQKDWTMQPMPQTFTSFLFQPSDMLESATGFHQLPDEDINGVVCYHFKKTTNFVAVSPNTASELADRLRKDVKVITEVWVGKEDLLPRKVTITNDYLKEQKELWGSDANVTLDWTFNFRYDELVYIEAPVVK